MLKKRFRSLGMLLFVCFLMLLSLFPAQARVDTYFGLPVKNADFEQDNDMNVTTIPGWTKTGTGTVQISTANKHSLNFSMQFEDSSTSTNLTVSSDKLSGISAGETYTASAMVYLNSGGFSIYLKFYDANNVVLSSQSKYYSSPFQQWIPISVTNVAPTGAATAQIQFYSTAANTASAYIDDAELVRGLKNPGFEDGTLTGWTKGGTGTATVDPTTVYSGSYSLKMVDSSTTASLGMTSADTPIAATGPSSSVQTYKASAMVYIGSGSASLYLKFYDAAGALSPNGTFSVSKSSPIGQWTPISVSGTAPSNAVTASVQLYSNISNTGTIYFDDVTLSSSLIDLGGQITDVAVHSAQFGKDSAGNDVVYTTVGSANPAKFIEANVKTGAVQKYLDAPDAVLLRAMAKASDGNVYSASSSSGSLGGKVYKYVPGANSLIDLGQAIAGETNIWDLEPGLSGKIYGGTSPNSYAFQYNGSTFSKVYNGSMQAGETYVRAVAYDSTNNILYSGIGAHAYLIRYNISTGVKTNILPPEYSGEEMVTDLDLINGKLFARLSPSKKMIVLDNPQGTPVKDAEIPSVGSRNVSPLKPGDNKIYFASSGELFVYDLTTKTYTTTGIDLGADPVGWGYVQLNETGYMGDTLVGMSGKNNGTLHKYNLSTGNYKETGLNLREQLVDIRSIALGPDNKIYTSGLLTGDLGVYNPVDGSEYQLKGIGQIEGMGVLGSKMYFGHYPRGQIYEYDPAQPWNMGTNPVEKFRLIDEGQDRPFAIVGNGTKLVIGTIAQYGALDGGLTVYDTVTGARTTYKGTALVDDQSPVALVYKNGKIYGGTTVWGGLGSINTKTKAEVFVWDTTTNTMDTHFVPIPTGNPKSNISAMIEGPDGRIWGVADGWIFKINPSTNTVTDSFVIEEFSYTDTAWKSAELVNGEDGYVYATIRGRFYRIDPSNNSFIKLDPDGDLYLAKDSFGDLYFRNSGDSLYKYDK